jgi:site-specific DNA-methyltransferase (adenine-specific)
MIETNKIYCMDARELLNQMSDHSVDLIVTSPPYNTGNKSLGYHPNSKTGDCFYDEYDDNIDVDSYYEFIFTTIKECIRVSRYTCWNMQMLSNNKDIIIKILFDFKENLKDIFIWKKQAVSQIVEGRLAKGYEFVFLFGKDKDMTFEYRNFPKNKYVPNIETWYKKESIPEHHATFPIELPKHFIKNLTKEGDSVLDIFIGSGTTAIAAKHLNRKYIGCDISQKYVDITNKRLQQNTLFDLMQYGDAN